MTQFLNNIWIALSTENQELVNFLLIPGCIIESYLFMNLILTIFNVSVSQLKRTFYLLTISIIGIINLLFIPSPLNVILNYASMLFLIKFFFHLSLLKSFISLLFSVFIFVILNILFQNPYITLLDITFDNFMNIPIYRIFYLFFLYLTLYIICVFLKKFRNIKLTLDWFDNLDKRTKKILYINIFIGCLTLCIQLITTAYYLDIVPIIITILNFILLTSFFMLSIYSFTRMIKLATTRRDLQSAEEYNKSLEILYDNVKGFKHDFDNIVSTLDGFIENNDMDGLKSYFQEVKKDCKITNNLSILNPRIINNPGIYSLLNNKYFKAINLGITFDIEYFLDLNKLNVNFYELSRILGILIDNAIEESEKCEEKIIKIMFRRENKNRRAIILIENTYLNKDVDISKIFKKGISGKDNHSGIGLWEVKNYITKSKNLDLFTTKNDKFFKQELFIYDI